MCQVTKLHSCLHSFNATWFHFWFVVGFSLSKMKMTITVTPFSNTSSLHNVCPTIQRVVENTSIVCTWLSAAAGSTHWPLSRTHHLSTHIPMYQSIIWSSKVRPVQGYRSLQTHFRRTFLFTSAIVLPDKAPQLLPRNVVILKFSAKKSLHFTESDWTIDSVELESCRTLCT